MPNDTNPLPFSYTPPSLSDIAEQANLDLAILKKAWSWAQRRYRSGKGAVRDDFASSPILPIELVKLAKADETTVLASILYTAVRPPGDRNVDHRGLEDIEKRFGFPVRKLVERTLRLRALDPIRTDVDVLVYDEKYAKRARLMSLWAAEDPRAILIRSVQLAINLERFDETVSRWTKEQFIWIANNIAAPVAYVAGYGKVREKIMERSYLLEDPADYKEARKKLRELGLSKEEELEEIKQQVTHIIERECGISREHFSITARIKTAASAREKTARKRQALEQLGDRVGFKVDIHNDFADGVGEDPDVLSQKIYLALSKAFGRGNKQNPEIRRKFAELVNRDPDPKDPTKDDRFDDYIKYPRDSGYQAIQDTFFVPFGNRLIECEGQIADGKKWEINNYKGPRTGHMYYKTGVAKQYKMIRAWYATARAALNQTRPDQLIPSPSHVFFFTDWNDIRCIKSGATVLDCAHIAGLKNSDEITGAQITNYDPGSSHAREEFYLKTNPVRNGDRITFMRFDERAKDMTPVLKAT